MQATGKARAPQHEQRQASGDTTGSTAQRCARRTRRAYAAVASVAVQGCAGKRTTSSAALEPVALRRAGIVHGCISGIFVGCAVLVRGNVLRTMCFSGRVASRLEPPRGRTAGGRGPALPTLTVHSVVPAPNRICSATLYGSVQDVGLQRRCFG